MARYVISVGGTGQHIALAISRLVMLGALKDDIRLIALDSDTETPLPQSLRGLATLCGGQHPLQDGSITAPFDLKSMGKKMFAATFVDADHPEEQELFETLFTEEEGSVPIYQGMYGKPCVGATVFGKGANSPMIEDKLKMLTNADEVFVCGSLVGGTGAGLLHKLVQQILKYLREPRVVYGIFLLPWFDIRSEGGDKRITNTTLDRNASHGVKYFFDHTLDAMSTTVVIGYPGTAQTPMLRKPVVTDGDMGETPSYLHLAAAHALVDLPQAYTANKSLKAYGIAHDVSNEGWLLDETWEQGRTLRDRLRAARVVVNFLSHINRNRDKVLSTWTSVFEGGSAWEPLRDAINDNAPRKKDRARYANEVLVEFERTREQLDFCVRWMQEIMPGQLSTANDPLLSELAASSGDDADSAVHWNKLRDIWRGNTPKPGPNAPNNPVAVAQKLVRVIAQIALKGGTS